MNIISRKNSADTLVNFLSSCATRKYVKGFHIDIVMTKDEQIIYYSVVGSTQNDINTIQNENFLEIKTSQFIRLEELLNYVRNFEKMIVINIYNAYDLLNNEIEDIARRNEKYINNLVAILDEFPMLDFYVETNNNAILELLKRNNPNFEVGLVVSINNLDFKEADYYSLTPNMINLKIMDELLKNGKEIMINFSNWYPSTNCVSNTKKALDLLIDNNYDSIYYITDYPEEFYNFLTKR